MTDRSSTQEIVDYMEKNYDDSNISYILVMYDLESDDVDKTIEDVDRWTNVRSFFRKFRHEEHNAGRLASWDKEVYPMYMDKRR